MVAPAKRIQKAINKTEKKENREERKQGSSSCFNNVLKKPKLLHSDGSIPFSIAAAAMQMQKMWLC
jgi:hypothetical protein